MKAIQFVLVMLLVGLLLVVPDATWAKSDSLELQWSNTYDDYEGALIVQALDGGFLLAVSNTTLSQQCLQLVKLNSVGEVEWSKAYPEIPWVPTLIRLADTGYLILRGGVSSSVSVDLLKVDSQGNIEWNNQHSTTHGGGVNTYVMDLVVTNDGNYVLVTYTSTHSSTGSGYGGSLFTCYDVDGVVLWHKWVDGSVCVEVVLPCASGGYYVGGHQNKQTWFAKLDSTCEVVWSITYGSVSSHAYIPWRCVCSVILVSDGGFLLCGVNSSFEGMGFVVKVDGEGLVQWSRKFGEPVYEVVEVREGQFLVFSFSKIVCLSSSGRLLWSESYSKYGEVESLVIGSYIASPVSAFVGGEGEDSLVVAIPHSVLGYYTSCLWVAEFTVEPISVSFLFGGVGLLFGCLVVAVVVLVFVGYWFYFKKGRKFFVG